MKKEAAKLCLFGVRPSATPHQNLGNCKHSRHKLPTLQQGLSTSPSLETCIMNGMLHRTVTVIRYFTRPTKVDAKAPAAPRGGSLVPGLGTQVITSVTSVHLPRLRAGRRHSTSRPLATPGGHLRPPYCATKEKCPAAWTMDITHTQPSDWPAAGYRQGSAQRCTEELAAANNSEKSGPSTHAAVLSARKWGDARQ